MKTKVSVFNPSIQLGGTNNLLVNLSILISTHKDIELTCIDYENGPANEFLREKGVQCTYKEILKETKADVKGELVITTLLSAKLIKNNMLANRLTRFIFWSTHIDDGIKILPTFNLFYRKSQMRRKQLAKFLNPGYKKRMDKFFQEGMNKGGIVWMNNHHYKINQFFFNLSGEPIIWPLITTSPKTHKSLNYDSNTILNVCVLGRLCDFKIIPMFALLGQIEDKKNIKLNFIGDGPYKEKLENELLRLGFDYTLLGNISKKNLDEALIDYDIVIGMGTSVLESAKLKIPTIVLNGSYHEINPRDLKLRWLYSCEKYEIGGILQANEKQKDGENFNELISHYRDKKEQIAIDCYNHWKKFHSDEMLRKIVIDQIKISTFYFTPKIASLLKFDLLSNLVTVAKTHLK